MFQRETALKFTSLKITMVGTENGGGKRTPIMPHRIKAQVYHQDVVFVLLLPGTMKVDVLIFMLSSSGETEAALHLNKNAHSKHFVQVLEYITAVVYWFVCQGR